MSRVWLASFAATCAGFGASSADAQVRRAEPYFYTAFGREFVGRASAILEAEIANVERIGVTTCTFLRLKPLEWLHAPGKVDAGTAEERHEQDRAKEQELAVLGKLATSPPKGTRHLFFLRRDPATSQLEVLASNPAQGERYARKRAVIEAYLRFALLEPAERFPAFAAFQEQELAVVGWSRWHALRELAEVAVAEPARFEPAHFARWRRNCDGDEEAAKTLDRMEREWRKAAASRARR